MRGLRLRAEKMRPGEDHYNFSLEEKDRMSGANPDQMTIYIFKEAI